MQIRGGDVEDDSESRSEDSDEEEIGDIILEEGLLDEEEDDEKVTVIPAEFHCDVRKFKKPMIKFQCTSYTNMTNQSSWTTVPPLLTSYSNQRIKRLEVIETTNLNQVIPATVRTLRGTSAQ